MATVKHVSNVQLPDLENPSFFLAHSGRVNVEFSAEQAVIDMANDVQSRPIIGARASQVPDVVKVLSDLCLSSAPKDEVTVAGDIVACVEDVSPAQLGEAPRQCHPQCYAGLGGEVICLFEMENVSDKPIAIQPCVTPAETICPDLVLIPSNTLASDDSGEIAWENLGSEKLPPCPHQVGSTLDEAKPTPLAFVTTS